MYTARKWFAAQWICLLICTTKSQVNSPAVQEVVQLSNKLVPKLLQDLYEKEKDFVASSFGLVTNLAMVMEGLDEKSREELIAGLDLQLTRKNTWQSIRNAFGLLFKEFEDQKHNSDVSGTYNNVVIHSSLPLVPDYKNILLKYYRANVTQIKQPKNITEHTMEVSSDAGVISHWKDYKSLAVYTYLEHQSQSSFTLTDGSTVPVPMVPILSPSAGYISALDSLAARLPLEDFSSDLYLIMPEKNESMGDSLKKLKNQNLHSLLLALPQKDYEVSIPQLSIISKDLNMKPILKSLGIRRIFKRNKTGDRPNRVIVSKVSQNSYFGTSFIGLKSVVSSTSTMKKQITRRRRDVASKIEFNKPFYFCVIHNLYGLILLNGVVTTPKQNP